MSDTPGPKPYEPPPTPEGDRPEIRLLLLAFTAEVLVAVLVGFGIRVPAPFALAGALAGFLWGYREGSGRLVPNEGITRAVAFAAGPLLVLAAVGGVVRWWSDDTIAAWTAASFALSGVGAVFALWLGARVGDELAPGPMG